MQAAIGMALILLIAASCAGESAEPEQLGTTAPSAVATTEAGAPTTPATDQIDPSATDAPTPPSAEQTGTAEGAKPEGATQEPIDPAPPQPPPETPDALLRGSVTYRERIALTPGATLTVQIRDTSLMDVASELIAEQVITDPGQVPIRFGVPYASASIDSRNTYSVSARITEADGRLAFINDTAYDVITQGNPTGVDMMLVMVQPPPELVEGTWSAEDARPVEAPVTVTGAEVLWEAPGAFVRVTFVISEQDGCYRRGREEATIDGTTINVTVTAWVPAPTSWAIDCSNETLELDAIAHVDAPLTTGQNYTVIVNGQEALTFTAR